MSGAAKFYLILLTLAWVVPTWWFGASDIGGEGLLLGLSLVALGVAWWRKYVAVSANEPAAWPLTAGGSVNAALAKPARRRAGSVADDDAGDEARRQYERSLRGHRKALWAYGASALFLGYILIQALNPAYDFVRGWPVGKLLDISNIAWLPAGMATPFSTLPGGGNGSVPYENSWRYLLIFGGAMTLIWATAVGVNRTLLLRRWLEIMVVHAVIFSIVALIHNISGSRLTYWFFYDPVNRLGGPQFPNGNQQGAYQIVLLAITLAAAFVRSEAKPFPYLRWRRAWFIVAPFIVWLGVMAGRHRAGILLGMALMLFALFLSWWRGRTAARIKVAALTVVGAGVLAAGFAFAPTLRETLGRFGEFRDAPGAILRGGGFRALQHEVAWEMSKDERLYGWGGGCYLYLFGDYYKRVPALATELSAQRLNRIIFPHADSDWLEFLAEYGVVGMALMLFPLMCWLAWLLPRLRRVGAEVWMLTAGVVCVMAQATIDPALRNPMVFSGMAGAGWLAVKLYQSSRGRRT